MVLYVLTNEKTGQQYVGATRQTLPRRLADHRKAALVEGRTYPICAAIREHGWESFRVDVLARPETYDELMRLEVETILSLGTRTPHGYNHTDGGLGAHGRLHSDGTKALLRARKAGYVPWNAGKQTGPLSKEHRAKLSAIRKGREPWNRGVSHSDETRRKMAAAHIGLGWTKAQRAKLVGRTRSEESRLLIAQRKREWWASLSPEQRDEQVRRRRRKKET